MSNNRYRGLRPNPEALGHKPLPPGLRRTKAMRFTLPTDLADRLDAMTKAERDEAMRLGLERLGRERG